MFKHCFFYICSVKANTMDRKTFIRNSLLGVAATGLATKVSGIINPENKVKQVGFNHLPNPKEENMKTVVHRAATRGHANHGWLNSHHSFSFANYYNPERMNFGVLRVLNDDKVSPGMGFGTHPHDNMEIISIPLEGDLEHKDNMGNAAVIKEGDIQVMSAGTGIQHSEYNKNKDRDVKFLQIWLFPNKKDVEPRYDQVSTAELKKPNEFYQILSPFAQDEGVWIHQDAWFHLGEFSKQTEAKYQIKKEGNGIYAFIINGEAEINGKKLEERDAIGISEASEINLTAFEGSKILLMEVPMLIN